MVARCKVEPKALVVVFERAGEEPVRVEAADGWKATLAIVNRVLERGQVRPGDRITVEAALTGD
jgi:translation initiation factor IF-1